MSAANRNDESKGKKRFKLRKPVTDVSSRQPGNIPGITEGKQTEEASRRAHDNWISGKGINGKAGANE